MLFNRAEAENRINNLRQPHWRSTSMVNDQPQSVKTGLPAHS